ncbi:MAG: hypothetical protein WCS99_00900 [Limisphaerales bacterium]
MSTHPDSSPRRRLLLVDTEHDFFVKITLLMEEVAPRRFVLEWASTYSFAASLLRRQRFDLCLISSRIGHRSGSDLVTEMRNRGCEAPAILLAGTEEMAEHSGPVAADYLDRHRLSVEMLRRAVRDAVFCRGEASPNSSAPVPSPASDSARV